jgi:hypothetical protein
MSTKKYTYDLIFDDIFKKIKEFVPFEKGKDLAEILDISPQMVTAFRKGRRKVPIGLVVKFAVKNNIPIDYLLGIEGAKGKRMVQESEVAYANGVDLIIPYLGTLTREETVRTLVNVKKEWLLAEFPEDRECITAFCMDADNMAPTINHNDLILVNRKLNSLSGAGIFALKQGGVFLVRRVFVGVDGSYNFKNDNEAYPPEKIPAAMFSSLNLEVLGKVVWWGGKRT